jgi:hypothetical protein
MLQRFCTTHLMGKGDFTGLQNYQLEGGCSCLHLGCGITVQSCKASLGRVGQIWSDHGNKLEVIVKSQNGWWLS